ncbi:MAG TPA: hypothetical protein VN643_06785 [Pyrinomonadaceae bacterium]|nr:hypothetical protein [Pyrinomonadaceae bacterium]
MTISLRLTPPIIAVLSIFIVTSLVSGQRPTRSTKQTSNLDTREKTIAARFAPIFYQALAENRRADYITNFDFDGDWRGDNNWAHTNDEDYPLKAYVYYSVVETRTHYFIHYAVFHGRDYKGGERKGAIISELIREGAKRAGKYDPTGIAEESALAHENDMEGCLVAVAKDESSDSGNVVFLETLRHNTISKYKVQNSEKESDSLRLQDGRPLLYIEPKGHGILAVTDDKQISKNDVLVYEYAGRADNPERVEAKSIGFELLPLKTTLWSRARAGASVTYGQTHDFEVAIKLQNGDEETELKTQLSKIGIAFVGNVGGINMARPPWGWFDRSRREETLGVWFFDPATAIKRDFKLDESFSTAYLQKPFWVTDPKMGRLPPLSSQQRH